MKVKGEIIDNLNGNITELQGSTSGSYCMIGSYYIYLQIQKCISNIIDILGIPINDGSKKEGLLTVTADQPNAKTTEKNIGCDQDEKNSRGIRSDIGLSILVTSVFWSSFV